MIFDDVQERAPTGAEATEEAVRKRLTQHGIAAVEEIARSRDKFEGYLRQLKETDDLITRTEQTEGAKWIVVNEKKCLSLESNAKLSLGADTQASGSKDEEAWKAPLVKRAVISSVCKLAGGKGA